MAKVIGDAVYLELSRRGPHEQKRFALIDQDDYERLAKTKWFACRSGKSLYATATSIRHLAKHHLQMHRYVLRAEPGQMVDHISGDTLDNRKQNLRIVTPTENARNSRRQTFPGKTSVFKGVSWSERDGRWHAQITDQGQNISLGLFDDAQNAARAYDAAALERFGEYARTNEMMRLFDGEMYIPDCSRAVEFDGLKEMPKRSIPTARTHQQRLDEKLRAEIASFQARR